MAHFVLRNTKGGTIARSKPSEIRAKDFIRRLVLEKAALEGADLDDLLDQVRETGDAASITMDGKLDLSGLDAPGVDLSGARGHKVDLSRADLRSAILDGADFTRARLAEADLSGARMRGAVFDHADMRHVEMAVVERGEGHPRRRERHLRKEDRFRPYDRVTAGGARFRGADLLGARLYMADLHEADFEGTSLACARIERCALDDACLDGANLARATVIKNSMVSNTVHLAMTPMAILRNNKYLAWPTVQDWLEAKTRMPSLLKNHVAEERRQVERMPKEMRDDYHRSMAVRALAFAAVAGTAGAAATYTAGLPVVSSLIAGGLVSGFALRRTLSSAIEAGATFLLERVGDVEAAIRRKGIAGLGVAVAFGPMADRMAAELDADLLGAEGYEFVQNGLVVVVDDRGRLEEFLRRTGVAGPDGSVPDQGIVLERDLGGNWPEEAAPWQVHVRPDGTARATWRGADGRLLKSVIYDRDGFPRKIRDHLRDRVHDAAEDPGGFFGRRRAVLEEIKDGIVRAAVPHDGRTHIARLSENGAIVVRCSETGKVDNAEGWPAIRRPDGATAEVRDGVPVAESPDVVSPGLRA